MPSIDPLDGDFARVRSVAAAADPAARVHSIDVLRGMVMALMALDHVRDFWAPIDVQPTDLARASTALYFTRWITHFCAPVFVFLAGVGAWLYGSRGRSRAQVARFLLTRGVWLIVLEFTAVHLGWWMTYETGWPGGPPVVLFAQVIWAIGWSMIVLAGLVFLPTWATALFGIGLIAGHNAADGVRPEDFGRWGKLWTALHVPFRNASPIGSVGVIVLYPLIPWIGVMATGYVFGVIVGLGEQARRRWCTTIGLACIALFVGLRWTNAYGEPHAWSSTPPAAETPASPRAVSEPEGAVAADSSLYPLMSFLNCTKYPPSLLYMLMTLGPAVLILPLLERFRGPAAGVRGHAGPRPAVLLRAARPAHQRLGRHLLQPGVEHRPLARPHDAATPARLHAKPAAGLRRDGHHRRRPLLPVPLVHAPQATQAGMVAELPVTPPATEPGRLARRRPVSWGWRRKEIRSFVKITRFHARDRRGIDCGRSAGILRHPKLRNYRTRTITGLRIGAGWTDNRAIVAVIGRACKAGWGSTRDDSLSNSSAANATRCLGSKSIAGA